MCVWRDVYGGWGWGWGVGCVCFLSRNWSTSIPTILFCIVYSQFDSVSFLMRFVLTVRSPKLTYIGP